MYSAVLFIGVMNCTSVQPVVAVERTVFYRERAAGMYSAFPYAFGQVNGSLANNFHMGLFLMLVAPYYREQATDQIVSWQVVIELPYALAQDILYGVIVYSMIGFEWTVAKFFWYLFFGYFTLLYFTFYGMMAVGMTPNYHIASIVSSAFYSMWNLFSGFIIPRPVSPHHTTVLNPVSQLFPQLIPVLALRYVQRVPIWWRWYCWICPVAWTLYGLVVSQFGDMMSRMDDGRTVKVFVEDYFDFKHSWLGWVAAVVVGFAVLFAALFGFAIMKLNFQKR